MTVFAVSGGNHAAHEIDGQVVACIAGRSAPRGGLLKGGDDVRHTVAVYVGFDFLHGSSLAGCKCSGGMPSVRSRFRSARVSDHSYMSGSSSRVSNVEVMSPPTTTVANGRCVSAPM